MTHHAFTGTLLGPTDAEARAEVVEMIERRRRPVDWQKQTANQPLTVGPTIKSGLRVDHAQD